jgi:hypothetical protein
VAWLYLYHDIIHSQYGVVDGSTAATGASLTGGSIAGAIAGDSLALNASGISLAYNSAHVASASSIGASGTLGLSIVSSTDGSQAGDYSFTAPTIASVAASITPATLTVGLTNTGVVKTYDGTTAAPSGFTPSYSVTGLVSGDTSASLADTSIAYNSAHVASATSLTVSGLSISGIAGAEGSQATDYALASSQASVAASITPEPLTVSIVGDPTKTYDGTTNATLTASNYSLVGLVGSDAFTVGQTSGAYNSPNVVGAASVTATLAAANFIPVGAAQTSDYKLPTSATGPGQVTPRSITITANDGSKIVSYPDPPLTYTITAGSLVQGDAAAGALVRQGGELPGVYAILQGTLSLSSNYALTYIPGTFTINGPTGLQTPLAPPGTSNRADASLPFGLGTGDLGSQALTPDLGAARPDSSPLSAPFIYPDNVFISDQVQVIPATP